MFRRAVPIIALAALTLGCAAQSAAPPEGSADDAGRQAWAAACKDFDEWDRPGPPFRIHGNAWYVGTCGITAVLITGSKGHVLIDSGTEAGARVVATNISALGLQMADVKVLLHSHEHLDHVGGFALLQKLSGARIMASAEAAPVITSGMASSEDPQAGLMPPMTPARVDNVLAMGETVRLGEIALSPMATPGHTPGALSWRWTSCDGADCRAIVFADSLSPISNDIWRFSDHPSLVAAFRAGLQRLAEADCAILLTPHPVASDMRRRLASPEGLAGPPHCADFAATIGTRLDERLAKESAR